MYYSSSDKTEYILPEGQPEAQSYQEGGQYAEESYASGDAANPEYSGNAAGTSNYDGDEYYDGRTYDPRDSWYRPNYSFVDPAWGSAYVPRYNPYSLYAYDPYYASAYAYDPYYSDPFWGSPYGSGLSISIGYNMGFGNYWRRPFYSAMYPYNSIYNYYGGGYYNSYAYNPYYAYYERPIVIGQSRRLQNAPRNSRSGVVTQSGRQGLSNGNGRPERGSAIDKEGQRVGNQQQTYRQTRGGATNGSVSPASNEQKQVLPTRPTRASRREADYSGSQQQQQPARQQQQQPAQQQQQQRPSRSREYTPAPVRTQPQREIRSSESSRPSRSYEQQSRPAPTPSYQQSSPSYQQSSGSNSSSGGGRPTRGRGN